MVGTVTLSGGAPVGGAKIRLACNAPGLAGIPSQVTIPAGSSTATFVVTTSPVSTNTPVSLSAFLASDSKTASLLITK